MTLQNWALAALLVVLFFFGVQYTLRYLVTYRLSGEHLEVRFLGVTLIRISRGEISEVRVVRPGEYFTSLLTMFGSLRIGNRMWGNTVLVRLDRGLFRNLIITPDDPDAMVSALKADLRR